MDNIENLTSEILGQIDAASDLNALEEIRVSALGKKGRLTEQMKTLGTMSPEERKTAGQALNIAKDKIAGAIDSKKAALEKAEMDKRLANETVDISMPIRPTQQGRIHPIAQVTEEMLTIFAQMGFDLAEGPDIEDDWHCFEALNFPKNHPARQMQATFFMGEDKVLRTHTSPVQIRTMENKKPPIRIVAPGRTYRCDYDATHTPMFHQIEGLVIDKSTNMGHLKGCLLEFLKKYFETDEVALRFRPSFFPFTEPSAEYDVGCCRKNGEFKRKKHADTD